MQCLCFHVANFWFCFDPSRSTFDALGLDFVMSCFNIACWKLHLLESVCSVMAAHSPLMGNYSSFLVFIIWVALNPFSLMKWVRADLVVSIDCCVESLPWKIRFIGLEFSPLSPFCCRDGFKVGEGLESCLLAKCRYTLWTKLRAPGELSKSVQMLNLLRQR